MLLIEKIVAYDEMLKECKRRKKDHESDIERFKNSPEIFTRMEKHLKTRICINTAISFRLIKRIRTLLKEYEENLTL